MDAQTGQFKKLNAPLKTSDRKGFPITRLTISKDGKYFAVCDTNRSFVSLRKIICQSILLSKSLKNGNLLERCFLTRLRSLILLSVMILMTRANWCRDFSRLVRIEDSSSMMSTALIFSVWMLSVNSKLSKKLSHQLASGTQRRTRRKVYFWPPIVSTKWRFGTQVPKVQERRVLVQLTVIESRRWKSSMFKDKKSPTLFTPLLKRSLVWSKCLLMEIQTRPWVSLLILEKSPTSVPQLTEDTSSHAEETIFQLKCGLLISTQSNKLSQWVVKKSNHSSIWLKEEETATFIKTW